MKLFRCGLLAMLSFVMSVLPSVGSATGGGGDDPNVTNLPKCSIEPWSGFATPEEAAAAPEDVPVCESPKDKIKIDKEIRRRRSP